MPVSPAHAGLNFYRIIIRTILKLYKNHIKIHCSLFKLYHCYIKTINILWVNDSCRLSRFCIEQTACLL